jgi:hypothetical protein
MPLSSLTQTSRWLACVSTPEQAEAYWRWIGPLREDGVEMSLCPVQEGQRPPWELLLNRADWLGLLLWHNDPASALWNRMARQMGIRVRWLPVNQDWLGACPSGQSRM